MTATLRVCVAQEWPQKAFEQSAQAWALRIFVRDLV
jgi:hypothetical protein